MQHKCVDKFNQKDYKNCSHERFYYSAPNIHYFHSLPHKPSQLKDRCYTFYFIRKINLACDHQSRLKFNIIYLQSNSNISPGVNADEDNKRFKKTDNTKMVIVKGTQCNGCCKTVPNGRFFIVFWTLIYTNLFSADLMKMSATVNNNRKTMYLQLTAEHSLKCLLHESIMLRSLRFSNSKFQ